MKINIDIITGFLGSGKTSFINALLQELYIKNEKVLIILLEDGNEKIKNDSNFDVFYFNDSIEYFEEYLFDKINIIKPDKIILEHNFSERLEEIIKIIYRNELKKVCKISVVYNISDIKHFDIYFNNMGELLLPCIKNSNLILLNNAKQVSNEKINNIKKIVMKENLHAHILICDDNTDIKFKIKESKLFSKEFLQKIRLFFKKAL